MSLCPFLTTYENKVDCFQECAFHTSSGSTEKCPFKDIKDTSYQKLIRAKDYDFFHKDEDEFEDFEVLTEEEEKYEFL